MTQTVIAYVEMFLVKTAYSEKIEIAEIKLQ